MVEHGGELVTDRVQVGLRILKPIARAHGHELVPPIEDAERAISFKRLCPKKGRIFDSIMFALVSRVVCQRRIFVSLA